VRSKFKARFAAEGAALIAGETIAVWSKKEGRREKSKFEVKKKMWDKLEKMRGSAPDFRPRSVFGFCTPFFFRVLPYLGKLFTPLIYSLSFLHFGEPKIQSIYILQPRLRLKPADHHSTCNISSVIRNKGRNCTVLKHKKPNNSIEH
jgi:hypothetical protein